MLPFLVRSIANKTVLSVKHGRYFHKSIALRSDVKDRFIQAVSVLKQPSDPNSPSPSNETKLKLYAYFKQAEEGECKQERPGMFDPVGRAKYDAWKSLGNMNKDEAMNQYIKQVEGIFGGKLPIVKHVETKKASSTENSASVGYYQPAPKLIDIVAPRRADSDKKVDWSVLKTVAVQVNEETKVATVSLNRPQRGNAFDINMWHELSSAMDLLSNVHPSARAVILQGNGPNFSTGMDLTVFAELQKLSAKETCEGRKREGLMKMIHFLQECVTSLEKCPLPVIAAIHGHCIGGAIDLIAAADIRYCTKNTSFCIKEADLAIIADMGTIQRLPKIIGQQATAELTYTCRTFYGEEAKELGLVLKCFDTEVEMMDYVQKTATTIAEKSPLTIRGAKRSLLYSRDHVVKDSLEQIQMYNGAVLHSEDLLTCVSAMMAKSKPVFKN